MTHHHPTPYLRADERKDLALPQRKTRHCHECGQETAGYGLHRNLCHTCHSRHNRVRHANRPPEGQGGSRLEEDMVLRRREAKAREADHKAGILYRTCRGVPVYG